ncbi:cupin domain-containing protein [Phenylobacterium sp.]|uniref:cupin domain-containing protein n=1 Tax=Phenylobacterium sp. TaxID=1871053 RepID=UPI0027344A15|nr:cupin domain-containing protein [Phenylobacterium sp.]MDP3633600.1 cupin domain-containing protein [Phenylobacterium sp.]MDP3867164.1 cupin domain-containing protein [Phenylobacterium sp.]MDZ4053421.1 cupin domain-containing protein [Phenylobacterium sp.]
METQVLHLSQAAMVDWADRARPGAIKAEWFAGQSEGRLAKPLGITQFGVNLVTLKPGAYSALRHWHAAEDEFVHVLSGELVLIDDNGEHVLMTGSSAGFPAGVANGHHLVNRSDVPATYLAVGSRRPGEEAVTYPDEEMGVVRK